MLDIEENTEEQAEEREKRWEKNSTTSKKYCEQQRAVVPNRENSAQHAKEHETGYNMVRSVLTTPVVPLVMIFDSYCYYY